MPTNWPPATAPPWPPPEVADGWLSTSNLLTLLSILRDAGFTQEAPTAAERVAFFNAARCDHGHQVVGRMLVSPGGTRYPVAVCNDATHRDMLVLWPPFYAGAMSGEE